MSDFVLTYKGIKVPDHILDYLLDDCFDLDTFITGVDAGLNKEPELVTPKLRAFTSKYHDSPWFEVEPGWFVAASTRAAAEEDFKHYDVDHGYGRSEKSLMEGSFSPVTPFVEA